MEVFKVFNDIEVFIALVVGAQAGDQLREAAKDQQFTFLNPVRIYSTQHMLAGINRAVYNNAQGTLKTHSVYSEIIYSTAATNSIRDAFVGLGIQPENPSLLVIALSQTELENAVKISCGEIVPLARLDEFTNKEQVIKSYGIKEKELSVVSDPIYAIYTRVALKNNT